MRDRRNRGAGVGDDLRGDLITDWLYGTAATIVTAGLILATFGVLWVLLPMRGRQEANEDS